MTTGPTELATAYARAWAAHDADAIVALHTEDSVFHVHGLGAAASGVASVRLLVVAFLRHVPDLHVDRKRVHLGTDHLVTEYDMSGTAGGSPFVCDGVDVIAVSNGLVARKDTYLDLAALQRQTSPLPVMTIQPPGTSGPH